MVKGAQVFLFILSWFHFLEGLGFQAGAVQAEPSPARREVWRTCLAAYGKEYKKM